MADKYKNYGEMMRGEVGNPVEAIRSAHNKVVDAIGGKGMRPVDFSGVQDAFRPRPMSPGMTTPDQYGPAVQWLSGRTWADTGGQKVFGGSDKPTPAAPRDQAQAIIDAPNAKRVADAPAPQNTTPPQGKGQPAPQNAAPQTAAIPLTDWDKQRIEFMQGEGMMDAKGNLLPGVIKLAGVPGVLKKGDNKYAGYGKPEPALSYEQQMMQRAMGAATPEQFDKLMGRAIDMRKNDTTAKHYSDWADVNRKKNEVDATRGNSESRRLDLIEQHNKDIYIQSRAEAIRKRMVEYGTQLTPGSDNYVPDKAGQQAVKAMKRRDAAAWEVLSEGKQDTPENINAKLAQWDAAVAAAPKQGKAEGGVVGYAEGGEVEEYGEMEEYGGGEEMAIDPTAMGATAGMDTGDYVFPVEAVRFYGTKLLKDMVQKAMMSED